MILHRCTAAVTALVLLTACGGGGEEEGSAKQPDKKNAASANQDQLQAKIIANAPPTEMVWLVPKAPGSWKKVLDQRGDLQWQVGSHPCVVTVSQPNGVGKAKEPTSEQVVQQQFQRIAQGIATAGASAKPQPGKTGSRTVRTQVTGLDGEVATTFSTGTATFGNGADAQVIAYRAGDFALIASAVCGKAMMSKVYPSQMAPFLSSLGARITY